ncbi:hypothetical protein CC117_21215 [Parafrankia colletiae]|uniref:DUF2993 domain-containing protein n=1 Tax=Parafrankia colletiae TaxID=573497 RepID=A0A1S1QQF4_9ACTN|nr:hypothetical protein CC117_21215 [Parafrankia colletiae]
MPGSAGPLPVAGPGDTHRSEWARPVAGDVPGTRPWAEVPPTRRADGYDDESHGDGGTPWSAAGSQWGPPPGDPRWAPPGAGPAPGAGVAPDGGPGGPGGPGAPDAAGAPSAGRRRRRRWIAALVALVVLLVLLVVGDRLAVAAAEDQMAKQVRTSVVEALECGAPPPTVRDVSIGGFPFLTQILLGKLEDIGLTIEGIATPGPRISEVQARLTGIHVPFGDMLSGSIGAVPVDDIRATVRVDYADLNAYLATLPGEIQVNPVEGGRRIEISGRIDIPLLGAQEVGGVTTFEVRNNVLTMVPSEVTLRGALNFAIPIPGGSLLPSLPIPVGQLPLDLIVAQASSGPDGLSLTATAHDVVLPKAADEPRQCPPGTTGPS